MKSLNENWFAFTLVAVIFGLLGFLLGRTTGHPPHPPMMFGGGEHEIIMKKGGSWITDGEGLRDMNIEVIKGDDGTVTVTVDSTSTGDGERQIRIIKKRVEEN